MSTNKTDQCPLYLNASKGEDHKLLIELRKSVAGNKTEFMRNLAKGGAYLHKWGILDLVVLLKERGIEDPVQALEAMLLILKSSVESNSSTKPQKQLENKTEEDVTPKQEDQEVKPQHVMLIDEVYGG